MSRSLLQKSLRDEERMGTDWNVVAAAIAVGSFSLIGALCLIFHQASPQQREAASLTLSAPDNQSAIRGEWPRRAAHTEKPKLAESPAKLQMGPSLAELNFARKAPDKILALQLPAMSEPKILPEVALAALREKKPEVPVTDVPDEAPAIQPVIRKRSSLPDWELTRELSLSYHSREVDLESETGASKDLLQKAKEAKPSDTDTHKKGFQTQESRKTVHPLATEQPILELFAKRADLTGLPVKRGTECQSTSEAAQQTALYSRTLRRAFSRSAQTRRSQSSLSDWVELEYRLGEFSRAEAVPALVQIMQAEEVPSRLLLIRLLGKTKGPEASVALAQRALYDFSEEVRESAQQTLKDRPREECRQVLLKGLRYPWSPVADHAADALAALRDRESVPELVKMLELPDPCAPSLDENKKLVMPELVRVNHLRNCLLCHAPSFVSTDPVRGLIPTPGQPIREVYYESSKGDFVRADVTYLRQDFSVKLPVNDPGAWPAMQRYDYLIRMRELTSDEAALYQDGQKSGMVSDQAVNYPQREAVLFALRELTGKDAGSKAEDWRRFLEKASPPLPLARMRAREFNGDDRLSVR